MSKRKPGSRRDKKEKRKLQTRTREGLLMLYNKLLVKMESGNFLRDEEIRFLKHVGELLAIAEAREGPSDEPTLPEGALREYVARIWKFKEEVGILNTRTDGLHIIEKAGYTLCPYCNEFHLKGGICPFEEVAKEKATKQPLSTT